MIGPLLLTAVLGWTSAGDGPDAGELIGRLVAEAFDDRVAAYKALVRLGGEALPALRAAADSTDPRIRLRVGALMESAVRRVATERVTRPTLVRFDFRDRPLAEVVHALNDRHDLRLALQLRPAPPRGVMRIDDPDEPRRLARLREGKLTLETAEPVPFWEAIDLLCKAAALRYDVSPPKWLGASQGSVVLMASKTGRGPVSDSGPFRVQVARARSAFEDFSLDVDPGLPGQRARPANADELTVPLAVLPEPGLVLHQNGPVTIDEAVDDQGHSLAARPPKAPDPKPANPHGFGRNSRASIEVNAAFEAPKPPVAMIRRLRGKVPVIVVIKRSDPLVIPLKGEGALGKPYRTREMTLLVDEVSFEPRTQVSVRLILPADSGYLRSGEAIDPRRPDFTSFNPERVMEHMELYDADGRRLNHALGGQGKGFDGNLWFASDPMIVLPGFEDGADLEHGRGPRTLRVPVPTELRYYGFVQIATEIPFDLRDISMP